MKKKNINLPKLIHKIGIKNDGYRTKALMASQ